MVQDRATLILLNINRKLYWKWHF